MSLKLLPGDAPTEPGLCQPDTPGPRIPEECVCWEQGEGRRGGRGGVVKDYISHDALQATQP